MVNGIFETPQAVIGHQWKIKSTLLKHKILSKQTCRKTSNICTNKSKWSPV